MTFEAVNLVYEVVAAGRVYRGDLLHALVVIADNVGDTDGRFRADGAQVARRLGIDEADANAIMAKLRSDQAIVPDQWPDGTPCWRIAWGRLRQLVDQRQAAEQ